MKKPELKWLLQAAHAHLAYSRGPSYADALESVWSTQPPPAPPGPPGGAAGSGSSHHPPPPHSGQDPGDYPSLHYTHQPSNLCNNNNSNDNHLQGGGRESPAGSVSPPPGIYSMLRTSVLCIISHRSSLYLYLRFRTPRLVKKLASQFGLYSKASGQLS